MTNEIERIKITITRITSPAEFLVKLSNPPNLHYQHVDGSSTKNTYDEYLRWLNDRSTLKCHLAFLVPTTNNSWSLTAIDKFEEYADRFVELAITLPRVVGSSSLSTAVILWGLNEDHDSVYEKWQNINAHMIYQGVARPTVHIDLFNHDFLLPADAKREMNEQMGKPRVSKSEEMTHQHALRWLPSDLCPFRQFEGMAVFVDDDLTIFVQDSKQQKKFRQITDELRKLYAKKSRDPITKQWNRGDICIAKRNGTYYRGLIRKIYKKTNRLLVNFVDLGCNELVMNEDLFTHTKFTEVPIQVRKCRLFNFVPFSNNKIDRSTQALKHDVSLILDHSCTFYIHDHLNPLNLDSIFCTVYQCNAQLDLASSLKMKYSFLADNVVLLGKHVKTEAGKRLHSDKVARECNELRTFDDFKSYYNSNKIIIPPSEIQNSVDDEQFEVFQYPCKRSVLDEDQPILKPRTNFIKNEPHHIMDRITKYFDFLKLDKPTISCWPIYVVDAITVLIKPADKEPLTIRVAEKQGKYFALEENSPCIALLDHNWHRGIVWEKKSTNFYLILFVDTLQISEINRKYIQSCPNELLHSKLQYIKVRLSKIVPNERLRERDVRDQLSNVLLEDKQFPLFSKFMSVSDDGLPEVKLYEAKGDRHTIYTHLVKSNFYTKIK